MKWDKVKLHILVEKPISGEWGTAEGSIKVIRSTNFTNDGTLNLTDVVSRNIPYVKAEKKKLRYGDIIIEKSGGSPTQPVGRVVHFLEEKDQYLCNNFTSILRPKGTVSPRFLFWCLFCSHINGSTLKYQNKTTGIINLQLERYCNDFEVPLPPLQVQEQIADTLDKADALRRKDQELIQKYDELIQAMFYEMFGDPLTNIKGWSVGRLIDNVFMSGGGTPKTTVEEYYNGTIPWVSPKDMKSLLVNTSIDKITELAVKESSTKVVDPFSVLMVVRSGILKNTLPLAINTVPVALNQDMKALKCKNGLNPYFLLFQLKALSANILTSVRGTTADNISSDVIKNVDIILPPLELQTQFESILKLVLKQKSSVVRSLESSSNLFETIKSSSFS